MVIMMMLMNMMMKNKIDITRLIFELGAPNLAWEQIKKIRKLDDKDHGDDRDGYDDNDDYSDDDDELDDEDQNDKNSANFQATSSRLCMLIHLYNTQMMIPMMMMIMIMMMVMMNMMMKIKMVITGLMFQIGAANFS